MLSGLLLLACSPAPAPAPRPVVIPHFAEMDRLVYAVAQSDAPLASVVARDLTEGAPGGSEAVGGALGFLQIAEPDELGVGLAGTLVACAECHVGRGIAPPEVTGREHAAAARSLWSRAAFGRLVDLGGFDGLGVRAPRGVASEAELVGILEACQRCHAREVRSP